MDSPTLSSFNYEQFFLEERQWLESMHISYASNSHSTNSETLSSPKEKDRRKIREISPKPEDCRATKNIAKNYGKAIVSFAASNIALPYLKPILQENLVTIEAFLEFMNLARSSIKGIDSFRSFLMIKEEDKRPVIALKKSFQAISSVFIKNFSANWIAHSRIKNKLVYLKYRFRILRRINNPDTFTYVKGPNHY